jgi:hypothetical protein
MYFPTTLTILVLLLLGFTKADSEGIDGSSPPSANSWSFNIPSSTLMVSTTTTVNVAWNTGFHSVVQFKDAASFASCDFTGATTIKVAGGSGNVDLPAKSDGTIAYYGCNVGSHCTL